MRSLAVGVGVSAAAFLISSGICAPPADEFAKIKETQDAISSLNLINGLYLTKEQQTSLLKLNKDMLVLRKDMLDDTEIQKVKAESEQALAELRDYLVGNPEKEDSAIQNKAAKAEKAYSDLSKARTNKLNAEYTRIVKEAADIFTPQQMQVINTFNSCLIPPKELRDPVRAGQAKPDSPHVAALTSLRKIKDQQKFDAEVEKQASKHIEHTVKYKFKMSDDEIKARKAEIAAVAKEARDMSDTDFELKKNDLSKKVDGENKMEKLQGEINKINPHYNPDVAELNKSKMKRFLLKPEIIVPILEKRVQVGDAGGLRQADQN
jgi:hypothetical protein